MRSWLVNLRKSLNLSQKYVAEKSGVSRATICRIELDQRSPSPRLAIKLGKILGFNWERFFQDDFSHK